jgi:hypothetical protein
MNGLNLNIFERIRNTKVLLLRLNQSSEETMWKAALPIFVLMLLLLSACGTEAGGRVGGPCSYKSTQGTAKIISLNSAASNSNNCNNNPVVVVFDFIADSPANADAAENNQMLVVGDGKNPPLNYAIAKGLTVGSTHPCTRHNISSGTCSPVVFAFGDVDLSDYAASCF